MSFPGSLLRGDDALAPDKVHRRQAKKIAPPPPILNPSLRRPLWLLIAAPLWCLVVLAMVSHDLGDTA